MKTANKPATTSEVPTHPASAIPFTIGKREYTLSLDYNDLAEAERKLQAQGIGVNLLLAFMQLDFRNTRILFAAALQKHHPGITYKEAVNLLTPGYAALAGALFAREFYKDLPAGVEAVKA